MIQDYKQFILWNLSDKRPVDSNGNNINPHDPKNWMTYDEAKTCEGFGVGFVFTTDDPFFFIDIDKCWDGNKWSYLAKKLCALFAGAAVEVSQSGQGLHIIGTGRVGEHSCKRADLGLEFYTQDRYVALTGDGKGSDTVFTGSLNMFAAEYFPPSTAVIADNWTTTHDERSNPITDDTKLIQAACKSASTANKFGQGITFQQLYDADVGVMGEVFPMDGRDYDASQADASLAQRLAWWTGNNCERIERIMRSSGLMRTKWDKHKSYLRNTILAAVGKQDKFYGEGTVVPTVEDNVISTVSGYQYMTASMQLDYFKDMAYIASLDRVFIPNDGGVLMKQSQFNNYYAGYVFQLDATGDKTTRKPWEAFVESQCVRFPKVQNETFRPDLPPGTIVDINGQKYLNSYVDIPIRMIDGDMSVFMDYLRRLLPDDRDREILISYMAACIQHRGVKFQWCPLIQGVEGNGKTLLTRVMSYAIGEQYCHMPDAGEISEKFNQWLFRKLFIGVEDVYVPSHKREVIEKLKPMITNNRLAMRAMQQDQIMINNFANFILNSNHRDAIQKHKNDRRFAIFYTAQQEVEHLTRDGMNGDYFSMLYAWLNGDGYAVVAKWLSEYQIPFEFNPALGCYRAPETTSSAEAIEESLGVVEQEVLEAIAEERPGFAGGWVSSLQLNKLLKDNRLDGRMPIKRRKKMMESLGYIIHPVLENCDHCRTNSRIDFDGGKPILYVKAGGELATNIHTNAEVARIYEAMQIESRIGGNKNDM